MDRKVTWKAGANVGAFAGKPVRLRFRIEDADLGPAHQLVSEDLVGCVIVLEAMWINERVVFV